MFRRGDDSPETEYEDELEEYGFEDEDEGASKLPVILGVVLAVIVIAILAVLWINRGSGGLNLGSGTSASSGDAAGQGTAESADEAAEDETIEASTGTEDFVIFGVDTRSTNLSTGTRSDSIMILHVDHDARTVRVCSIYRDCMVHIEDHGYEKITHAHSYGGPELALSTINENFDLEIENYLTVNFINVADLIDEIGGVDQDITSAETEYINGYIDELNSIRGTSSFHITSAGTYTLDGTQAVAFSRIRYTSGGDYTRTERQRTILFKVFEAAKELGTTERISIAEEMIDQINTNYTTDDLVSLLYYLQDYEITDMSAYPQVFYGGTVDGAWVEVPVTLIDMAGSMHEFLYDETDYTPSDTVTSYSSTLQGKASTANNDMRDSEEDEEETEADTDTDTDTAEDTE